MKTSIKLLMILSLIAVFHSCKTVDLRTDYVKEQPAQTAEEKGRQLLADAAQKMGYDKLANTEVYETTANFKWKGLWPLMPMNSLPGNLNKDIQFKFATNSFDGQVKYLEGRKEGLVQGLQSWEGYKIKRNNGELKQHEHDRYIWGLATYHYLVEAPLTMKDAEIVRYAGEKEFDGQSYETVYVTWGTEEPNKQYDRFLVYVNKDTGFIDMAELTIGDFYLPMPKGMQHATVQWDREMASNGTYLPSMTYIQLGKPKDKSKYVYKYSSKDYKFDSFPKSELYPIEGLTDFGNSKKFTNDQM